MSSSLYANQWKSILTESWYYLLKDELEKPYFRLLMEEEKLLYKSRNMLPEAKDVFNIFKLCPPGNVKVLCIGQDPYSIAGTAHGIAFSTLAPKTPVVLRNIFKEIKSNFPEYQDKEIKNIFPTNNLSEWVKQGVFLLNAILTVEEGTPMSRSNRGWEQFTSAIICKLLDINTHMVIMGWGKYAQSFIKEAYKNRKIMHANNGNGLYLQNNDHDIHKLILFSTHPSASSYGGTGWFGNMHFAICNQYLKNSNITPIVWSLK
jgi:uracil-DNA glycosylase